MICHGAIRPCLPVPWTAYHTLLILFMAGLMSILGRRRPGLLLFCVSAYDGIKKHFLYTVMQCDAIDTLV
jgi:uncharacterized membrane protein